MSKTKFHEVNGCTHFIPVKVNELFERSADITIYGKGCRMVVDSIYSFQIEDKPKKPVIPQFVADWIEECKEAKRSLYNALEENNEVNCWIERDDKIRENEDTFARAWLDGYEIEKEKLYTVELPNPNNIGTEVHILMMNGFKQVVIKKELGNDWKKKKGFQLTESEIKQDFEWAWQWAEEVADD